MKKFVVFFCLLLLTSCSEQSTDSDMNSLNTQPTHQPSTVTSEPTIVTTPETMESLPIDTPNTIPNNRDNKPYEFSVYFETDFDLLNRDIPAEVCPWSMSTDECIELYGTKPAIPDGITVHQINEDENYRYFLIQNTLTGNSTEISVTKGLYDSYLSDVIYSVQNDNNLIVSFYFDYLDDIRMNHSNAYDIEQRYYQTAGPIHSHTRYHLVEGETYSMEGNVIASNDCFNLGKFQSFNYVELMDDVEYSLIGIEYLESVRLVDLAS